MTLLSVQGGIAVAWSRLIRHVRFSPASRSDFRDLWLPNHYSSRILFDQSDTEFIPHHVRNLREAHALPHDAEVPKIDHRARSALRIMVLGAAVIDDDVRHAQHFGTGAHLAGELFRSMAGLDLVHVPYKGGGAVMPDVIAGRVHMSFATLPSSLPHVRSGKLRALGLASKTRSPALPDLPTISEAGLPGYDASNWMGLFAPARTPRAIVDRIDAVFSEVLRAPELKDKLLNQGFESAGVGKQAFAKTVADEIVKWRKIIRESGAKAQ